MEVAQKQVKMVVAQRFQEQEEPLHQRVFEVSNYKRLIVAGGGGASGDSN